MLILRKSQDRGYFDYEWLQTYHTFSFGEYDDENYRGFSVLRVINEDTIAPGKGFPMHGHHDMEIITFVTQGALEHQDSMGNSTIIKPGEIQRMSAGSGVRHSEFNALSNQATHLLQIWILPDKKDYPPSYDQKPIDLTSKNKFLLIAAKNAEQNIISLHQDIQLFYLQLESNTFISHAISSHRQYWLQIIEGQLILNDLLVETGDGVAVSSEVLLNFQAKQEVKLLLFDLP